MLFAGTGDNRLSFSDMPAPAESAPKVKIAHVLSTDVVGYSLLLITEQIRVMNQLTSIVKSTEQFCQADAQGKLMSLPTGDGMSLVFLTIPRHRLNALSKLRPR